jgi:branched-chain amino acid transport system permease protein
MLESRVRRQLTRIPMRPGGWRAPVVVLVVCAGIPLVVGDSTSLLRYDLILIYMLGAFALNLAYGYGGQLALAQPVVMGCAAYAVSVLSVSEGWAVGWTLLAALVSGYVISIVLNLPGVRLQGWYLAVTTFFAAIIFPDVIDIFATWTNGGNGIGGIPPFPLIGPPHDAIPQYEFLLAVVAVIWLGIRNLVTGTWGVVLRGIRDSPDAARSAGINVAWVRMSLAGVASLPAALAGWLWAYTNQFVAPSTFGFQLLIFFLAAVMLGGRGTLWGPVIGTVVFQALSLWIGPFSSYNQLFVGIALLAISLAVPRGVVPLVAGWLRRDDRGPRSPESSPGLASHGADTSGRSPRPVEPLTALRATGISKSFGGMAILTDVDLVVESGTVVGLVGPNGSGKTTLLNVITGYVRPDRGTLAIAGDPIPRAHPHEIARLGVRRSFQIPQLIDELPVLENVELALLGGRQRILTSLLRTPGYRRHTRDVRARARAACADTGLDGHLLSMPVGDLPLGLKRVVEVARATAIGAKVVCLDEPAAGLSGADLDVVGAAIQRMAGQGHGVLLIEHNLDFVRTHCDSIIMLRAGQAVRRQTSEVDEDQDEQLRAFFSLGRGSDGRAVPEQTT